MKKLGALLAALIVSLGFAANSPAQAGVAASNGLLPSGVSSTAGASGLVHKTHGWHCRARRGYVPSLGYRALHRHRAACRRRGRCHRRHRVCRNRWGYGWRFRRCLRRAGC
ncbi:MAG: hypothetical protein K0U74_11065 [Alphaproteobacteria bacterium]|nr:hypothetical protein [Alphaproteobacteria bacterium]